MQEIVIRGKSSLVHLNYISVFSAKPGLSLLATIVKLWNIWCCPQNQWSTDFKGFLVIPINRFTVCFWKPYKNFDLFYDYVSVLEICKQC